MKISIIIVEDDLRLQGQLIKMLNRQPDFDCVLAVSTADEAIKMIPQHNPDVVLMDINLPGRSGIDCLPILRSKTPTTDILMLTAYEDDNNIFRALKSGATGYLLKSSGADELFAAIRNVYNGGSAFSGHIARRVVGFFQTPVDEATAKTSDDASKLSPREKEVLDMLAAGMANKEIADVLGIGDQTVRTYMKRVCVKLHVRNRIDAIIKYHS